MGTVALASSPFGEAKAPLLLFKYLPKTNFKTVGTVASASSTFSGAKAPLPSLISLALD